MVAGLGTFGYAAVTAAESGPDLDQAWFFLPSRQNVEEKPQQSGGGW